MKERDKANIYKRIIDHFEKEAPGIVRESVASLATAHPNIDFYDEDFYLGHLQGDFTDIDKTTLRELVLEYIDEINAIFLKYYKTARKPS